MSATDRGSGTDEQENKYTGRARTRIATTAVLAVVGAVSVFAQPAAASHDSLPCEPPEDLSPLFDLLHGITELLFMAGVGLGTIGFITGGIYMMLPGDDASRKGKTVWKYTLFGTVLVLSSEMVMSYMISTLSPGIC